MISKCTLLLAAAALAVAGPGCVREASMDGRFATGKTGAPPGTEITLEHKPGQARNPVQLDRTYAELDEGLQAGVLAGILRFVRRAGWSRRGQQAQELLAHYGAALAAAAGSAVAAASREPGHDVAPAGHEPATGGNLARGLSFKVADRAGAGQIPGRAARNYTPVDPMDRNSGTVQKVFAAPNQ
ncbi:MAG: hypothetical protein ACLGQW_10395 [Acidobacteriota bacterium]